MTISDTFKKIHNLPLIDESFALYENRIKRLDQLQKLLTENESAIYTALKKDLGKSEFESYLTEVALLHEEIKESKAELRSWMSPKTVGSPLAFFPCRSQIQYRPLGTVLIISPWNYPVQLIFSPLVGAIAAGNNVVLKPSEIAPSVSSLIAELIPKYFQLEEIVVIEGGVDETSELLSQNFAHIFFTGSTNVGKIVMEKAAKNLTPVTLELGGKSPCLIFEEKNFDLAVKRTIWGKFMNAGQTCVAPDYILLKKGEFDAFLESAKKWIKVFYGEDPLQSESYGKIINLKHYDRLSELLNNESPELKMPTDRDARHLGPTILRANADSAAMQDEIFGPILPVIEVDDLNSAIEFVQQRPHPLSAYLFSSNPKDQITFKSRVQAGGLCLNDVVVHLTNKNLPFGGVGPSGLGSYHGKKSFLIFSHECSVMSRSYAFENSLRYPPGKNKLHLLKKILPWVS
jgi:aldehyde dehydrogenase (NAD+)